MTQKNFLSNLLKKNPDAVIVGSLGNISKDLSRKRSVPNEMILIRGAMGCAIGAGVGYATGNPKKHVIVVIGDGACLMKLGSLSTAIKYINGFKRKKPNLEIHVLNNSKYASCGGQETNFDYLPEFPYINFHEID